MPACVDTAMIAYYQLNVAHVRYPNGASGLAIARAVARQKGQDIATALHDMICFDHEIGEEEALVYTRIERQRAITASWPGGRA